MKKVFLALAVVGGLGVYWLVRGDEAGDARLAAPAVQSAGVAPSPSSPAADGYAYDRQPDHRAVAAAIAESQALMQQKEERVGLGDTATLKFEVPHDHARYGGMGSGHLSAKAFRGTDRPVALEVKEVEKGKYEVPFTPQGPGQFNVVLSDDNGPVASRRVGVVGVAGADSALTDPNKLDEADPMVYRARTPGRLKSR